MPYIKQSDRDELDHQLRGLRNAGELNYEITKLIQIYLDEARFNYQGMNDVLGALEGAKLEFYARVVRPYEDEKIKENGDVY